MKILRWLLAALVLANLLALAAVRGLFGPLPYAGPHEFRYLIEQVNPDTLQVRPETTLEAADQAVVGTPSAQSAVKIQPLSPSPGATSSGHR